MTIYKKEGFVMALAPFWTDPQKTYAKRNNLFIIQVDFNHNAEEISDEAKRLFKKVSGVHYVAKAATLPSFNQQTDIDRNVIGGSQKIATPEPLDWQSVRLTFADFVDMKTPPKTVTEPVTGLVLENPASVPDSSLYHALLHAWHEAFGRNSKVYQGATSMNLARFREIFQNVIIMTYNDRGEFMEQWSLRGLWPLAFENSSLSYEDDGIREFSIELDYETAEFMYVKPNGLYEKIFEHQEITESTSKVTNKRAPGKKVLRDRKKLTGDGKRRKKGILRKVKKKKDENTETNEDQQ